MNNMRSNFRIETVFSLLLGLLLICPISATANDAARSEPKTRALIERDLSQKLKADLSASNLSVKFKTLEEAPLSNNVVEVKGDAFCVLPEDKTELPLKFEAKYDLRSQTVTDVSYSFVESAESSFAPSTEEEMLMKNLMKQIGADYKTDQITIAIDDFNAAPQNGGKTAYQGAGEIKIGPFVWNKFDFNIVVNDDKTASEVKYKINE